MIKTLFGVLTASFLFVAAAAYASSPAPSVDDGVTGKGECAPSGAKCKFGSDCCSKICKAGYTCK